MYITSLLPRSFSCPRPRSNLTESVYTVVSQKSNPAQIRQLILDVSNNRGYVEDLCEN